MRTHKEVIIDGHKYHIGHWAPDLSTEILAWLTSTLGPLVKGTVGRVKSTNGLDIDLKDINFEMGIEIFDSLIRDLALYVKPAEYSQRLRQIVCNDQILRDGRSVNYNLDFAGKLKSLHQLAFEVLKFQYEDFFDAVQSASRRVDSTTGPRSIQAN